MGRLIGYLEQIKDFEIRIHSQTPTLTLSVKGPKRKIREKVVNRLHRRRPHELLCGNIDCVYQIFWQTC